MRKPSPDDMIYAGLLLRLGLTTDEEIRGFSHHADFEKLSFIEIMLKRGILSPQQHAAIQGQLDAISRLDAFAKRASGAPLAAPEIDQYAIPTIIGSQASPGAAAQPASAPAHDALTVSPASEAPTYIPGAPTTREVEPEGAPTIIEGLTGGPRSVPGGPSTLSISSMTGALSRADLDRARDAITRWGDSLLGSQIAGYVLLDKLGRGGMGEVYLAKQLALNRYVALKVLPASLGRDQQFVQRFIREAQTLAKLNFPSIVQVFDVGAENGVIYFTMELVKGRSLNQIINESGRLPVEMAVNVIKQVCRGLARVGREGIIHRDIKPSNIMITEAGEVKVCDFGIAADYTDDESRREVAGTPYYIAPECLTGEEAATSAADEYSLGVTFQHMLMGLPGGAPTSPWMDPDASLSDLDSSIPQDISEIIQRMTRLEARERYNDFEQIFRRLETYEMKTGLLKAPSEFIAERLIEMREIGMENFRRWAVTLSLVATGFTALSILANRILAHAGLRHAIALLGAWGTVAIFTAYAMILYVGLARKRILPAIGNLRSWVENHYRLALAGYFMVMIHGGNFLGVAPLKKALGAIPGLGAANWNDVPAAAFLASLALFLVIISGLIGRFIFRDLHKQVALERFGNKGDLTADEKGELTRLVIGTRIMGYWRVLHYPMTVLMILLTVLHVVSILYFGGGFFGVKP